MPIGLVSCLLLLVVAALVALVLLGWRRWHDRRERARIIGILPRDEGQLDGGTVAQHDIARSRHKGGKKCRSQATRRACHDAHIGDASAYRGDASDIIF